MRVAERDGGSRDSNGGRAFAKGSPVSALPALSINDYKGTFSFDDFFKSIIADVLPSLSDDESRLSNGNQGFGNGSWKTVRVGGMPSWSVNHLRRLQCFSLSAWMLEVSLLSFATRWIRGWSGSKTKFPVMT